MLLVYEAEDGDEMAVEVGYTRLVAPENHDGKTGRLLIAGGVRRTEKEPFAGVVRANRWFVVYDGEQPMCGDACSIIFDPYRSKGARRDSDSDVDEGDL